jgi:uncharacterized membrane protein
MDDTTCDTSNLKLDPCRTIEMPRLASSPPRDKLKEMMSMSHDEFPSPSNASTTRPGAARTYVTQFLILVDVTIFALSVADVHGPVRIVLGLILGAFIPGWCIVQLLKLDNVPLEIGLTITVSLSLLMIIAQVLITINSWHLVGLEEVTCVICLPFLVYLAKIPALTARRSR